MPKGSYFLRIDKAVTLDDLDVIAELAAADANITNAEYGEIYSYTLKRAQSWCCVC